MRGLHRAEQSLRASLNRSRKTRREWVTFEVDTLALREER